MHKLVIMLLSLIPAVVSAQTMPSFDPSKMPSMKDMQKMMQQAEQMQVCMENIDQSELKQLEERGNAVNDEIRALCASGDESEAMDVAMSFSTEVRASKSMQDLQACSKDVTQMLQGLSIDELVKAYGDADDADEDLCESIN